MAQAVAFGSINIVDLNDIGELSVQPMSNLPLAVVYDPDQNNYTPDWSASNVMITPVVYYAGKNLTLGSTGLTISWERQEGTSGRTGLTTGETVINGGILKITANKFNSNSTMITYIVTATYVEPTSRQSLISQGQITYSLVKNASTAKTCSITGDSIFKYNTDQSLVGATSITLSAKTTNVAITAWQYQNENDEWVTYPGSSTDTTLTINATDSTFVNDKCMVRLLTDDPTVYDLHTIIKLRDGAAGSKTVSAVLTNDDQMIPFDSQGQGDYTAAVSQIMIFEGGTDVTNLWAITQEYTGLTASPSRTVANNDTVAVSMLSGNSGNVTFIARRSGYDPITKTFSVVKVASGADGKTPTIYMLEADSYALNKSITNTYTPATVTFTGYQQTGGQVKKTYAGRFQIFENITLAQYDAMATKPTPMYTSTSNEVSKVYTPSASATSILCILYAAGATTTRYDAQLVAITNDGQTGAQGEQGEDGASAVNIILGNYADVLTCTSSNALQAAQTIRIPFSAYEGTKRIPCVVSSTNLLGVAPTIQNATETQDGYIQWVLPAGKAIGSENGTLSLTFNATASTGGASVIQTYSWSRSTAARDGANAVLLQIFTPSGTNIFNESTTSVTMRAQLTDGSQDVTGSATYQWAKWSNGSYANISGATKETYTVQAADVDSYASYRLTATYKGSPYLAYFSVLDKTDPIQVAVLCSIGTQIVNGVGAGGIYCKVTRNGAEIDTMKSERFLTANPASAKAGDYYYKIDEENKTLTLMKYTSSWASSADGYEGTYTWTWRDKNGNPVTSVNNIMLPTSGKVIYIDGDMIDGKIIADVKVEI